MLQRSDLVVGVCSDPADSWSASQGPDDRVFKALVFDVIVAKLIATADWASWSISARSSDVSGVRHIRLFANPNSSF
jgi:hypothetical protein